MFQNVSTQFLLIVFHLFGILDKNLACDSSTPSQSLGLCFGCALFRCWLLFHYPCQMTTCNLYWLEVIMICETGMLDKSLYFYSQVCFMSESLEFCLILIEHHDWLILLCIIIWIWVPRGIGQLHPITVYRTGFWVCAVLVLSVFRCSFLLFPW